MLRRIVIVCVGLASLAALPGVAAASEGCPNESLRTGLSSRLPDCRAYEQVSPVEKEGTAIRTTFNEQGLLFKAAQGGQQLFYVADNALPGTEAGGQTYYLATRGSDWTSLALSPSNLLMNTPQSGPYGITGEYRWLSEDLACQTIQSSEPLTADTPQEDIKREAHNLYLRNADGSYTLLSNQVPLNRGSLSGYTYTYSVLGASPDCKKVLFETSYELLAGASEAGTENLYEWDEGTLRSAGVMSDGSVEGVGSLYEASPWNRLSRDGSRVFFSAGVLDQYGNHVPQVFLRENNGTPAARTVEASASQTSTPAHEAHFQGASQDGSRVWFLSNFGLAQSAPVGNPEISCYEGHNCDLYEYDVEAGTLTDATARGGGTEAGDVMGVLAMSTDARTVYLAALGQLTPSSGNSLENTETENEANGEYNVYRLHEGAPAFVGRVTREDATQSGPYGNADLIDFQKKWSARTTPDGSELLFTSRVRLTGYDNTDALAGTPDLELYLYSGENREIACVSCNPSGARPRYGSAQGSEPTLVPISQATGGGASGDVLRVLGDDGNRVFFESSDALSPLVKSGEVNVYEWERAGTGSCTPTSPTFGEASGGCLFLLDSGLPANAGAKPAAFADASASGDDVFLQTATSLVSQDKDSVEDVYDVRVGGGLTEPQPTTVCEGEACQGLAPGIPTFGTPGSASFSGADQAQAPSAGTAHQRTLTRAQKLARALKACHRKKGRRRRAACRRNTIKRFGARRSGKAATSRGGTR
jgi:hypothetical protein